MQVFPPNYPNLVLLGWSPPLAASLHVVAHGLFVIPYLTIICVYLGMFTYYPKDPYYVLCYCSLYMINLNCYVLMVLGLTHACVVPNVFETDEFFNFIICFHCR